MGTSSVALGEYNTIKRGDEENSNDPQGSITLGSNNTITNGQGSVAIGHMNNITSFRSAAIGNSNIVTITGGVAIGEENVVENGMGSVALGLGLIIGAGATGQQVILGS
jgi:hypothetical protein